MILKRVTADATVKLAILAFLPDTQLLQIPS